jgi:hypothetical protein
MDQKAKARSEKLEGNGKLNYLGRQILYLRLKE